MLAGEFGGEAASALITLMQVIRTIWWLFWFIQLAPKLKELSTSFLPAASEDVAFFALWPTKSVVKVLDLLHICKSICFIPYFYEVGEDFL